VIWFQTICILVITWNRNPIVISRSAVPNMLPSIFYLILNQQEREHYEYIISEGKIIHKQTGDLLDTTQVAKWIFVMSTSKRLYAGEVRGSLIGASFVIILP